MTAAHSYNRAGENDNQHGRHATSPWTEWAISFERSEAQSSHPSPSGSNQSGDSYTHNALMDCYNG